MECGRKCINMALKKLALFIQSWLSRQQQVLYSPAFSFMVNYSLCVINSSVLFRLLSCILQSCTASSQQGHRKLYRAGGGCMFMIKCLHSGGATSAPLPPPPFECQGWGLPPSSGTLASQHWQQNNKIM